jgi:hypothetical protein
MAPLQLEKSSIRFAGMHLLLSAQSWFVPQVAQATGLPQLSLPVPHARVPQSLLVTVHTVAPPVPVIPPLPTAPPAPVAPPLPTLPPVPVMGASGGVAASGGVVRQAPVLARQRPPEQQPSLHVLPAQHTSPRLPHLAHMPSAAVLEQARPLWQRSAAPPAGQQVSPEWPHEAQVLLLQVRPS